MGGLPSDGLLAEELTRRGLLERLGLGAAALSLPGVLATPARAPARDTLSGGFYATGESCSLGTDTDVYHMPLTGEYIQTRSSRICATTNWSDYPPEAFDIDFLLHFWRSLPTAQQQAAESAGLAFIGTHWGPPSAPAVDLSQVKTPSDFPNEVVHALAARTARVEFEVPKTDFQKFGWTPTLVPGSIPPDPAPGTPLKLRGWYIKGDGLESIEKNGAITHPLVILSSGFPYSIAYDQLVGGIDVGRQLRKTATYFVARGFDLLFFDKRGTGYSEGLLEGIGEDVFRILDLLEHGAIIEDGVPLTLSVITADQRRLTGGAAAAERLLGPGYTAKTKPVILRGFSYGSSHMQRAMAMNYSDLPVDYRFTHDASGAVVVDETRTPAGNRAYNFRGIVAISGFQGSLKYETTPYFVVFDAGASAAGHNGSILKSTVFQSMDRWPAQLGLYASNDYETADGAIDAYNQRLRGVKKIMMVTGYHFGLASEEVDTYFAEESVRFATEVLFQSPSLDNTETTTYAREICHAEPVVMDPAIQSIIDVPSRAILDANRRVDRYLGHWIEKQ